MTRAQQDTPEYWAQIVVDVVGRPLDEWAVAATLESQGLRDADARERFGHDNLFLFANEVHRATLQLPVTYETPDIEVPSWTAKDLCKHLFFGSFFALPMFGQLICLLATRYSLWASLDFSERQATIIAVGTIASFVVTGGAVMAIGRQGTVERDARSYRQLRFTCTQVATLGALFTLLMGTIATVVQVLSPYMGTAAFAISMSYFIALCLLWIALAVLYMLGLHHFTVAITVLGALLVAALVRWLGVDVYLAQILAIAGATGAALVVGWVHITRLMAEEKAPKGVGRPCPPDVRAGILFPFIGYGMGYFSLLFIDRALAWTAPGRLMPEPIWFYTPYELGLDWALCTLLIPMAYLEHIIRIFSPQVMYEQASMPLSELDRHCRQMSRFLRVSLRNLAIVSVLSVLGSYFAIIALADMFNIPVAQSFISDPVTVEVFWFAAVAYQLLTFGLLLGLVLFTLNRGQFVLTAILRGLAASAAVGWVFSRLVAPHWAVVGLLAGCAVFCINLLRTGQSVVRDIDFYYYSAY